MAKTKAPYIEVSGIIHQAKIANDAYNKGLDSLKQLKDSVAVAQNKLNELKNECDKYDVELAQKGWKFADIAKEEAKEWWNAKTLRNNTAIEVYRSFKLADVHITDASVICVASVLYGITSNDEDGVKVHALRYSSKHKYAVEHTIDVDDDDNIFDALHKIIGVKLFTPAEIKEAKKAAKK